MPRLVNTSAGTKLIVAPVFTSSSTVAERAGSVG
jgi:hypothetical protein